VPALQRNLKLYAIHQIAFQAFFWFPIFFLYYLEIITLKQALFVDAFYYLCVVLLEVPSGYFADRFGRKLTLLISSISLFAAYLCFYTASSFSMFLIAKIFFAIAFSFSSGADTSFFYSSLESLGKQSEYGDREANIQKWSAYVGAGSALIGGFCGSYLGLKSAYLLSMLAALVCVVCSSLFVEPSHKKEQVEHTLAKQINKCLSYLKHPLILWLSAFMVLMTILNHIPYEFYQQYIDLLHIEQITSDQRTPITTGILAAAMNIFAAYFSGKSMKISRRIGVKSFFLSVVSAQTIIITCMAYFLEWWVLVPIILYRVPARILSAPFNQCLAPEIQNEHRSTFLSLISLGSRLAYGLTLMGLTSIVPHNSTGEWAQLSKILQVSSFLGLSGLLVLYYSSGRTRLESRQTS